jgi:hypothetical protein
MGAKAGSAYRNVLMFEPENSVATYSSARPMSYSCLSAEQARQANAMLRHQAR